VAAKPSSRLADLTEMRELLWLSIKESPADKRAPLFARLESVVEQIERLSPQAKAGDPVDEIAKRRAARGAGSATSRRRTAADEG
jgi:hypothetical protein